MKQLGIKPINFPNKEDYRSIEKGYVNWWENIKCGSKKSEKKENLKYIQKELLEYEYKDNYSFS